MAEYTIELRHVVSRYDIFDFPYSFYDERRKRDFEEHFIRHFYFREIGSDTPERFKFYLEEKMHTVFPYYNELFKTAQIEYSVLDNYNIKETTTMKRENTGSSSGESYTVGTTTDEQSANSNESRQGQRSTSNTGESTANETVQTDGENTHTSTETFDGVANQTIEEGKTKTASETETIDDKIVKKFLDTPQGKVNLDSTDFLTTINQDTKDQSTEKTLTETETGNQTINKTENTEKTTMGTDTSTVETTKKISDTTSGETTETDGSSTNTSSEFTGERRSTNDGAIRSRNEGTTTESVEVTRKGNIGVDTDADMIQKHIKLQKILSQIERMFFDECEDLFMLVM